MLTQDNLKNLLAALGFENKGAIYQKTIDGALLEVDLAKREIRYPEAAGLLINERQTCNFDANENFVVLECVYRLLEKGYKPQHIELEPKWKLGRGASGGRADVLIKDNAGRPLLIIECKTAGSEFKRAWGKTLEDGDQLFSYAQQISETQFLCLYASELDAGQVRYTSHVIAHRDNEKYLNENPDFKSFQSATNVKERFAVWRDTYRLDYATKGIFEANIQPYQIGKNKYGVEDLSPISASDQQKKYHEFATILRQHNVSGRENAFDKLVNLFLCKLVDEIENPNDLKFYWKGVAYDTHFDLMDRLQQLYQAGMGKFLGEDITYINQADVFNAMRFIRQDPDATQRAVWGLFIKQKFFTNSDFSLIDVHNQKLFYQNAEVLLKILQMWQDIRLTHSDGHNQFLGDMFEGFLDQGVKQSEGQYFTPMPICRFILMSLPLDSMVQQHGSPPKAIDYACGAGHFLTELALQLKPLVARHKPDASLNEYHRAIYGIEKEYRLSKVAKVSAFMYGQQEINICYGDALVNQHAAFSGIQDGSFDILVANPPYSVRGFLETLPEKERQAYKLADSINELETANSIEAFFIERAKQLLRTGGVAAIVLPSSILSNSSSIYIRTREILIQYFDIVAIAEFGSGTFGKTGTNTVTLFLRRKSTTPDTAQHYRERVAEWFRGDAADATAACIYQDEHLLARYCAHIQVPLEAYKTLLQSQPDGPWATHLESVYLEKFNASTEVATLYKAKWFKALPPEKQALEIDKRYLAFVQAIERDKLYHFVMACDQKNPVLIIRSPTDTKEQKKFLGYEWSSAKGGEGIKIAKDASGHHLTPLYDEINRANPTKLNALIAANFDGNLSLIPQNLHAVAQKAELVEILDFSRVNFEKNISLNSTNDRVVVESKFPLIFLSDIADISRGASPRPIENYLTDSQDGVPWIKIGDVSSGEKFIKKTAQKITKIGAEKSRKVSIGDFIVSNSMSVGRPYIVGIEGCVHDGWLVFSNISEKVNRDYLFYVLSGFDAQSQFQGKALGGVVQNLNIDRAKGVRVPLPDIYIQEQIVSECQEIDDEVSVAQENISSYQKLGLKKITEEKVSKISLGQRAQRVAALIDPQKIEGEVLYIGLENIEGGTGRVVDVDMTPYADIKSVKSEFSPGDVLYGKLRPNLNKVYFAENSGICSTDILVFRFESADLAYIYSHYLRTPEFNAAVVKTIAGQQLPRTSWEKLAVLPVPDFIKVDVQRLVISIKILEKQIAEAQAVIDSAPARKQAILQKYL